MLARIEELQGVEWAAVEATGRFLAVRPGSDQRPEVVAGAVVQALGRRGARAGDGLARAQLAARGRGDPWFTAAEVHALSYVEGRLVAVHAATRVGAELALLPAVRAALAEAVREHLFDVLERVHAEGGRESSGWFYGEWPGIAAAAAARITDPGADRERLAASLAGCYLRSPG